VEETLVIAHGTQDDVERAKTENWYEAELELSLVEEHCHLMSCGCGYRTALERPSKECQTLG
jgi:hypothetical protein